MKNQGVSVSITNEGILSGIGANLRKIHKSRDYQLEKIRIMISTINVIFQLIFLITLQLLTFS